MISSLEAGKIPPGWTESVVPKYIEYFEAINKEQLRFQQIQRWADKTGEHPATSSFTVIVPIHNEEHALPGFLTTLRLSDVPNIVKMQVVFVTNACTDNSSLIIQSFLKAMDESKDSARIEYVHLDIPTPGKANALTIGNKMAVEEGNKVAICVDSDVLLEPDAIRNLYARASQSIDKEPDGTVLVNGVPKHVARPSKIRSFWRKIRPPVEEEFYGLGPAQGMCMAWSTQWITELGGIPPVANEDYAMSVVARLQGYKIGYALDAHVWQYTASTPRDILETTARMTRCVMQIRSLYPGAEAVLRQDHNFPSMTEMWFRYLGYSKKRPFGFPIFVLRALLDEAGIIKGKIDFKKNPTNQSWVRIKSTK